MLPSKPNSPSKTVPFRDSGLISPCEPNSPIAIDKSKPVPDLGIDAGESEMVVLRLFNFFPIFISEVRTRSRDSFSDASGNPKRVKLGRPSETSTSTVISYPARPVRAMLWVLKTDTKELFLDNQLSGRDL